MSAKDPLRTLGTVGRIGESNELLLLPIRGWQSLLGWDAAQPHPNRLKNNADKPCKRRVPFPISMPKP